MSNILSFPNNETNIINIPVIDTEEVIDKIIDDVREHKEEYNRMLILTVNKEGQYGIRSTPTSMKEILWDVEMLKKWVMEGNDE